MTQTANPKYNTCPPSLRNRAHDFASAGSEGQDLLRVKCLADHARDSKIREPPKMNGLCSESQISWGTVDVKEDSAAPIPSVIKTAGNVQQTKVERLVSRAKVGAAVSRIARRALLIIVIS